jgi:hypothetical protein
MHNTEDSMNSCREPQQSPQEIFSTAEMASPAEVTPLAAFL